MAHREGDPPKGGPIGGGPRGLPWPDQGGGPPQGGVYGGPKRGLKRVRIRLEAALNRAFSLVLEGSKLELGLVWGRSKPEVSGLELSRGST